MSLGEVCVCKGVFGDRQPRECLKYRSAILKCHQEGQGRVGRSTTNRRPQVGSFQQDSAFSQSIWKQAWAVKVTKVDWGGGWRVLLVLRQQPVEVILPLFQHIPKILLKKHNGSYLDQTMKPGEEKGQADAATDNQMFYPPQCSEMVKRLAAPIRTGRIKPKDQFI